MKKEIPSRRAALRGALAVGCSLCLPAVLFGCDSKQSGSSGSAAPASPPAPVADSAMVKKVSQASVQYQPQPKDGQKCFDCQHFISQANACVLVEGEISSEGWCIHWLKRV